MTYAVRGIVTWVGGLKCRMAVKMIAAGDTARVSTWRDGSRSAAEIGEFCTCNVVSGFIGCQAEGDVNELFICGFQLCTH